MASRGVAGSARVAAVALVAVLLAFQVVRSAAVADREGRPRLAAMLWPSHPAVMTDQLLLAIASAAARGRPAPEEAQAAVSRIAAKAPLSPDPFLIAGAIAQSQSRGTAGEALLTAARDRDPRSRGARFLLADRYLRTGRITAALVEMQALVSLQSRGLEVFGPSLAAFARTPGAGPQLKAFFKRYPRSEASALSILAKDAANADLVLTLANDRRPRPDWRGTLVSALAKDGQFAKARATWARLSGVHAPVGLFNADFAAVAAPPPFNWSLPETSEGVAEMDGEGGLTVLYYGRAKAALASQLLLLPAGQYRLALKVTAGDGGQPALHWLVNCAKPVKTLLDLPLKAGAATADFAVPAGCEAQWLRLQAIPTDSPQTTEVKIHDLRLAPRPVQ
jgi:hypothetical protein